MKHLAATLIAGSFLATGLGAVVTAQDATTQAPVQVKSGDYVLDASHGKITWSIDHLGFSTYIGQFIDVDARLKLDAANPANSTLTATVDADKVSTANDALDKHIKAPDFLDAAKFPKATFKATSIKQTGARTADIVGDLTLHGVTKPLTIKATFNKAGVHPADNKYTIGFDGEAVIKRSEYGVKGYLPVLGDEVALKIEAEFKPAA